MWSDENDAVDTTSVGVRIPNQERHKVPNSEIPPRLGLSVSDPVSNPDESRGPFVNFFSPLGQCTAYSTHSPRTVVWSAPTSSTNRMPYHQALLSSGPVPSQYGDIPSISGMQQRLTMLHDPVRHDAHDVAIWMTPSDACKYMYINSLALNPFVLPATLPSYTGRDPCTCQSFSSPRCVCLFLPRLAHLTGESPRYLLMQQLFYAPTLILSPSRFVIFITMASSNHLENGLNCETCERFLPWRVCKTNRNVWDTITIIVIAQAVLDTKVMVIIGSAHCVHQSV